MCLKIDRNAVVRATSVVESVAGTPDGIWKISEVALALIELLSHVSEKLSLHLRKLEKPFRLVCDNIVFLQLAKLGQEWLIPDDDGVMLWKKDKALVGSTFGLSAAYLLTLLNYMSRLQAIDLGHRQLKVQKGIEIFFVFSAICDFKYNLNILKTAVSNKERYKAYSSMAYDVGMVAMMTFGLLSLQKPYLVASVYTSVCDLTSHIIHHNF